MKEIFWLLLLGSFTQNFLVKKPFTNTGKAFAGG